MSAYTEDEQAEIDSLATEGWVLVHASADLVRFEKLGIGAGVVNAVGSTLAQAIRATRSQGIKTHPGSTDLGKGSAGSTQPDKQH